MRTIKNHDVSTCMKEATTMMKNNNDSTYVSEAAKIMKSYHTSTLVTKQVVDTLTDRVKNN